jgi:hypothetical protein
MRTSRGRCSGYFHARPGVHYDAHLPFADMALICGRAGQRDRAQALIAEGAQAMEQWPEGAFRQVGGVEARRRGLEEAVADPARLRAAADAHASALQVDALPSGGVRRVARCVPPTHVAVVLERTRTWRCKDAWLAAGERGTGWTEPTTTTRSNPSISSRR